MAQYEYYTDPSGRKWRISYEPYRHKGKSKQRWKLVEVEKTASGRHRLTGEVQHVLRDPRKPETTT